MVATTVPSNPTPTDDAPNPSPVPAIPRERMAKILRTYALEYFLARFSDVNNQDGFPRRMPLSAWQMQCAAIHDGAGQERRCGMPLTIGPRTVSCTPTFGPIRHHGIDCITDDFARDMLEFREKEGYPRLFAINDDEVVLECPKCEEKFLDKTMYDLHRRSHPYQLPLTKSEWHVYLDTPHCIVDIANKLVADCLASHTDPLAAYKAAQEKLDPLSDYGFADTDCRIVLECVVNTHFGTDEELWLK